MKYKGLISWLLLFSLFYVLLQLTQSFHFFYMEQFQFFLFTTGHFTDQILRPGGLTHYIGEFFTQYYSIPYVGAGVTAGLLTGITIFCRMISRKLRKEQELPLLYLLPALGTLFITFDFNYLLQGTIALLLVLAYLLCYFSIPRYATRLIVSLLTIPLLFGLAGAAAALAVVCITGYELVNRTPKGYLTGGVIIEYVVILLVCYHKSYIPDYAYGLLPDAYYHLQLKPPVSIYIPWIGVLLIVLLSRWLPAGAQWTLKKRSVLTGIQIVLLAGLAYWGIDRFSDRKNAHIKELIHYARTQQWDKIIEACSGTLTNYLYIAYLNRALIETGQWEDKAFHYDQRGQLGIFPNWDQTFHTSALLSDVCYTMGLTGIAQRFAFEAHSAANGEGSFPCIQRLVQTNLIYGEYAVAEKYISLLEKTSGYRKWAGEQRRFLYNDSEVSADPGYGWRRKMLPEESRLSLQETIESDLLHHAVNPFTGNPSVRYTGVLLLLNKNIQGFRDLIERYYGTPLLEELPYSFQQAVFLLEEKDEAYWARFDLSDRVMEEFAAYRQAIITNRNNRQVMENTLRNHFSHTYWFYYIYK